jgi:tetratricopeptide (TPR) repeat protein
MKKAVFVSLLFAAALSLCIPAAFAQDPGQVTIKDQAEFNAYNDAESKTGDAKAAAIEGFLQTYPNSVVKDDLLGDLMTTYTSLQEYPKAIDAANRLLKDDPNNLGAFTIEVYSNVVQAGQTADPAAKQALLDDAAAMAQRGLDTTKPIMTPQADWDKRKNAATPIFAAAMGADADAKKDTAGAEKAYITELKSMKPADTQVPGQALQDTFNLGVDYLHQTPPDYISCAFYAARASYFAPGPYKSQMLPTATYCFKKYQGPQPPAGQTFDKLQALAQANVFAPADLGTQFTMYVPPKPSDLAHQAVISTPDLNTLALQDKEFILGNGTTSTPDPTDPTKTIPGDADKVWAVMNGVTAEVPGTVISATADQIQLAVSDDAIQSKTADFTVNMKEPLKEVPAAGTSIKVVGTFDSYTKMPTMIILKDGTIPAEKKPPAAHHPVHHAAH